MQITVNRETKIKKITLVLEGEEAEMFAEGIRICGIPFDLFCKPGWKVLFEKLADQVDRDC